MPLGAGLHPVSVMGEHFRTGGNRDGDGLIWHARLAIAMGIASPPDAYLVYARMNGHVSCVLAGTISS